MNEDGLLASLEKTLKDDINVNLTKDDIKTLVKLIRDVESHENAEQTNFQHMVDMITYYIKGYQDASKEVSQNTEVQEYRKAQKVRITVYGDRVCPRCGYILSQWSGQFHYLPRYCPDCGQYLDWTEV